MVWVQRVEKVRQVVMVMLLASRLSGCYTGAGAAQIAVWQARARRVPRLARCSTARS